MKQLFVLLLLSLVLFSCKKDEEVDLNTTFPEIINLTPEKRNIKVGETTDIFCEAIGGELSYEWSVLLGDIIPVNEDASQVTYSGFACCAGEKVITCTVSNDKGSAMDTVVVNILE